MTAETARAMTEKAKAEIAEAKIKTTKRWLEGAFVYIEEAAEKGKNSTSVRYSLTTVDSMLATKLLIELGFEVQVRSELMNISW